MLHYDAVFNPTGMQQGLVGGKPQLSQKSVVNQAQHISYLEQHPHQTYPEEDMKGVCT